MTDRETIIRLALSVDRLRGQVRDAEDQLAKRKAMLEEAVAQLDAAMKPSEAGPVEPKEKITLWPTKVSGLVSESIVNLAGETMTLRRLREARAILAHAQERTIMAHERGEKELAGRRSPTYPGVDPKKSLKENLRDLFEQNPDTSFPIAEISFYLGVPDLSPDRLRQTLKRLFDDDVLMREREGVYMLNPMRSTRAEDGVRQAHDPGGSTIPAGSGPAEKA